MFLDLHRRKRARFVDDREVHDLYRRIIVERPDMLAGCSEHMTSIIAKLIEQAVEAGDWKIDDVGVATGVVRDAVTFYLHPVFVEQLETAGVNVERLLGATVATLTRAFDAGVHYGADRA